MLPGKLVSVEDRPEQGPPKYPYGEQPRGLPIYDATGHMAIQWIFERVK